MGEGIQVRPRDDDKVAACVYCREPAPASAHGCAGCGAVLHPECQGELRARRDTCPTPGCGRPLALSPAPRPHAPETPRRPRPEDFTAPPQVAAWSDPAAPPARERSSYEDHSVVLVLGLIVSVCVAGLPLVVVPTLHRSESKQPWLVCSGLGGLATLVLLLLLALRRPARPSDRPPG